VSGAINRQLAILTVVVGSIGGVPQVLSQSTVTDAVRSTVTAEMGDVGGTFFGQPPDPRKTRRYYIAAEPELWDYAPSGRDEICGTVLPPDLATGRQESKVRYVQYTNDTFRTRVIANPSLGIMGPVLRGVVGEFLAVTFLNRASQPLSMHPHGVKYDKDSEGAYYRPGPGRGAAVGPGGRFTYVWRLDEAAGPKAGGPASQGWLYHSHVQGDEDTQLGLIGCIIVTDAARARPDGTPADVDREFAALFMIFDESGLGADEQERLEYGLAADSGPMAWARAQQRIELGSRYAINGRVFGNLPGFDVNEGERVRWYLFALGSELDFHTAHWHGLRVVEEGRRRTDVVELLPATMKVADMLADNPGTWLFHCHVAEHMREGMFTRLVVYPKEAVGADRSPGRAFLGLPSARASMRLEKAEAALNFTAKPAWADVRIVGAATVFEAFPAFKETIRVQMGRKAVVFTPDRRGMAQVPGATLKIRNADGSGVVRGGMLEFELRLEGESWAAELRECGANPATELAVTLTMGIGLARHSMTARINCRTAN